MASPVRAGKAMVELGISDRLSSGLRAASSRLKSFGASATALGAKIGGVGAAITAPFAAATKTFVTAGDQLDKMAKRTGFSVEALSQLKFAAEQSGSNIESLGGAVQRMNRRIGRLTAGLGSGSETAALEELGLTARELDRLTPEERFLAIAEAMKQYGDNAAAAGLAQRAFGTQVDAILPLLLEGAKGIQGLRDQADSLGLTIDQETASQAAELADAMNIVRQQVRAAAISVGAALAPSLVKTAEFLSGVVKRVLDWVKANGALIRVVAKVGAILTAAGAAVVAIGLGFALFGAAIGGLAAAVGVATTIFAAFGTVLAAIVSPIGIAIAAVGLGVAAFLKFSGVGAKAIDFLGDRFLGLSKTVDRTVGGIRDALAAGDIKLAAEVLWAGIQVAFQEGTLEIRQAFFASLDQIKLAFNDALAGLLRGWAVFTGGIRTVWERTQAFLAKRFLELQGIFDKSLDVEAAKDIVDDESAARIEEIIQGTQRKLLEIGNDQKEGRDRILDGALKRLGRQRDALEEARKALDDAIAESAEARADAETKGGSAFESLFDDFAGILDGAAATVAASNRGVLGTFGLRSLELGGGGSAAERTATAAEKTAENTERLANRADRGGTLTFK